MSQKEFVHKSCPHCNSTKGFRLSYEILGYGTEDRDFNGFVLDATKEQVEDLSPEVECLECKGKIKTELVKAK